MARADASIRPGLFHVAAAVDADCLAGDEVALEECQHAFGNLDLTAPAAERRRLCDGARFLFAGTWRRNDRPWRDRVDQYVVGGEFEGERLGERDGSRFRDEVRQVAVVSRTAALRD